MVHVPEHFYLFFLSTTPCSRKHPAETVAMAILSGVEVIE